MEKSDITATMEDQQELEKKIGVENLIDHFAPGWNTRNIINNQNFDEIFHIDGIPLSWFFKRIFSFHTLPIQFQTKKILTTHSLHQNRFFQQKRERLSKRLKRLYFLNEQAKIRITPKKKVEFDSGREKILFLSYFDHIDPETGAVFRIEKILNLLESQQHVDPILCLASPSSEKVTSYARKVFFQKRHRGVALYQFLSKEDRNKANHTAKELEEKWLALPLKMKEEIFISPAWECLRAPLDFYFSWQFLYFLVLYYETLKGFIQKEDIREVVMTASNSLFERCLNAAASYHNVPTLLIQHGTGTGSTNPELRLPYTIAVFSTEYQRLLLKRGIPATNVKVVGPLIFDEIYPYLIDDKIKKYTRRKILLLTVPFIEQGLMKEQEYFQYILKLVRELRLIEKVELTIKLHPREKTYKKYVELLQKNNIQNINVIQKNGKKELYSIINDNDILLHFGSTAALEGLILKKVVVTISFPSFTNIFYQQLRESNATLEVSIAENFNYIIQNLLINQELQKKLQRNSQKFVQMHCGDIDGKSSERLTKLLEKLAKRKKEDKFKNHVQSQDTGSCAQKSRSS